MTPAEAFEAHQAALLRLAGRWARPDNIEDCVQNTWAKAVVAWDTYRGDASRLSWLAVILRNECRDFLRRQRTRRNVSFVQLDGADFPAAPEFDHQLAVRSQLGRILRRLKPKDRDLLLEWSERPEGRGRDGVVPRSNLDKIRKFRALQKARRLAA